MLQQKISSISSRAFDSGSEKKKKTDQMDLFFLLTQFQGIALKKNYNQTMSWFPYLKTINYNTLLPDVVLSKHNSLTFLKCF